MTDHESADPTADLYRALLEREARLESLMERLLEYERRCKPTTSRRQTSRASAADPIRLTEREAQILHLLIVGRTNRQIGTQLQLATGTVRNYLGRIFRKLGATTRTQAAVRAMELGLTTPAERLGEGNAADSVGHTTSDHPRR